MPLGLKIRDPSLALRILSPAEETKRVERDFFTAAVMMAGLDFPVFRAAPSRIDPVVAFNTSSKLAPVFFFKVRSMLSKPLELSDILFI